MTPNPAPAAAPDQYAFDVNLHNFAGVVIETSRQVPVLVDFWAPWCQPCQALKPLLEKLAAAYGGRFVLAKINSDEHPDLAREFGVRSIPAVKVVIDGRVVDEFTGALPEAEVRAFIDRLLPSPAEPLRLQAEALRTEGRQEDALALLSEASQVDPANEAVRLDGIELLLDLGRLAEAERLLGSDFHHLAERAQGLQTRLELSRPRDDQPQIDALHTRLDANPDDHALRLQLAQALAARGDYPAALEAALEVVRRDRHFDEGAGRQCMLKIFSALGQNERHDALIRDYRRRLSATLN